jgi:hypothetical protein
MTKMLLESTLFSIEDRLPKDIPTAGIYLFSKGSRYLYVGRSDNILQRMSLHTRRSAGHNQATFAFRMAKRRLGIGAPSYRRKGSRPDLLRDATFAEAFAQAKQAIRRMEVRFLSVEDPVLEIGVSLTLKTSFNEFETT